MDEGGSGDAREIPLATFTTAPPFPSGEGGGGRARQKNRGERKGKRRKWQQLSYRRKLPPSVYPTTIRSCVPSTPPACASFHRFALTPFSPSTPAVSSTLASFFSLFVPRIGFSGVSPLRACRLCVSAGFLLARGDRQGVSGFLAEAFDPFTRLLLRS